MSGVGSIKSPSEPVMQVSTQVQLNADEVITTLGQGLSLVESHPFAACVVLALLWLIGRALLALAQVYKAKNTTTHMHQKGLVDDVWRRRDRRRSDAEQPHRERRRAWLKSRLSR